MILAIRIFFLYFAFLCIIACVSPTANPISADRSGTYRSGQILQPRSLQVTVSPTGSLSMSFEHTNGSTDSTETFDVAETNISGLDPNYSFQNGKAAGTLKFISDTKVIVQFQMFPPDEFILGETLCIKTN